MYSRAEVYLWGRKIAYIDLDENGCVNFEYTKDFLNSSIEISPIMMPLANNVYRFPELINTAFKGAPGLIADSLPDRYGNAVIDNWLAKQGRLPESFNIVERLCYIGKRGMGALEYKPALSSDYSDEIEVDKLVELANEVLQKREEININAKNDDAINQLFMVSSSAGGARAKAIIAWNKEKNIIKSGQIDAGKDFEYYLIKFDGVTNNGDHGLSDSQDFTKTEYVYYLMAKLAGIEMTDCELFFENGRSHFITKRFDRINNEKLHMQTFASLCHVDYNTPRLASYEMLALRCFDLHIPKKQLKQLYTRMVFNVLGVNNDDHVKNFSFLMDKEGNWSLSPAYDLTFAYNPNNLWLSEHQMTINGKSKDIKLSDLLEVAKVMKVNKKDALNIIENVKAALSHFKEYAEQFSINNDYILEIDSCIKKAIEQAN